MWCLITDCWWCCHCCPDSVHDKRRRLVNGHLPPGEAERQGLVDGKDDDNYRQEDGHREGVDRTYFARGCGRVGNKQNFEWYGRKGGFKARMGRRFCSPCAACCGDNREDGSDSRDLERGRGAGGRAPRSSRAGEKDESARSQSRRPASTAQRPVSEVSSMLASSEDENETRPKTVAGKSG